MIFNNSIAALISRVAVAGGVAPDPGTWLLRATWDSAADQGYTDAQVLDTDGEGVEDGSLTVVETDGTLSVENNRMLMTEQASPVLGDLGLYSNSITRAVGVGLNSEQRMNFTLGRIYAVGFGNTNSSVAVDDMIYIVYIEDGYFRCLIRDGSVTVEDSTKAFGTSILALNSFEVLIVLGGFSSTQTVWTAGSTTGFEYGAQIFAKNVLGDWARMWVAHANNDATLYGVVSNLNQEGTVKNVKVPDPAYIDFSSALAPTTYLGGSQSASTTFTHPEQSFIMKFVLTYDGTYGAIEFRRTDANNRYFIDFGSGRLRLYRTVSGASTELQLTNGVFAATNTYSVLLVVRDAIIRVYVNGGLYISYNTAWHHLSVTGGNVNAVSGGLRDLATWEHFPSSAAKTLLESISSLPVPSTSPAVSHANLENVQNQTGHRYDSIATVDIGGTDYQAATFWGVDGYLVIGKRAIGGAWTFYRYNGVDQSAVIGPVIDDNHNTTNLGIDPDGYIHVSYDHHHHALKYRRSNNPINTWTGPLTTTQSMLGTNETDVTYPTFFNDPTGKLYFLFRFGDDGGGNVKLMVYSYNEGTTTWSGLAGTTDGYLINAGSIDPYWNGPPQFDADFGAGGFMHLSFHWRTSGSNNEDVSYVKWDGTDWLQADGTAQTVPITKANCEIADETSTSVGLSSFNAIAVDDNGNPHIFYPKEDGSGFVQIYHLWHNGTAWQTPAALTNNTVIASGGDESDSPQNLAAAGNTTTGRVYVFYNAIAYEDGNVGLKAYYSDDYSSWTNITVESADIGNWRPQLDRRYWNMNKDKFYFPYIQYDLRIIEWTP